MLRLTIGFVLRFLERRQRSYWYLKVHRGIARHMFAYVFVAVATENSCYWVGCVPFIEPYLHYEIRVPTLNFFINATIDQG